MNRSRLAFLAVVILLAAAATAWSTPFPSRSTLGYPGAPEPVAQGSHWTIDHISSALHIANRTHHSAIAVRCVNAEGTHWESCGGGSSSSTTVDNIRHITSVTHVTGSVFLKGQNGTAVTLTGTALDVNCTGCSAASTVNVGHISSAVHVVGLVSCSNCTGGSGDAVNVFHQSTVRHISSLTHVVVVDWQRWAHVAAAQSGLWNVTAHQGGSWTVAATQSGAYNVSSAQSGAWTIQAAHQGGQWTIAHITSALHIAGVVSVTCANCSGGSGDAVNVFHQSTIRHISSLTHVVIVDWQRWAHVASAQSGVWSVTAHQGGSWTVAATQSGAWNVSAAQSGSFTIQAAHQGGTWNIAHLGGALHLAGSINGARIHIQGLGVPGAAHGGVLTVQGSTGMIPLDVNCTGCSAASAVNVAHISAVTHVTLVGTAAKPGSGHLLAEVTGPHASGAIHVSSISNIGSGNAGTGTTAMACHSTLAIHLTATNTLPVQLIHLTSSNNGINQATWRIYICSIYVNAWHTQAISILEGKGETCATGKLPVIGSYQDGAIPIGGVGTSRAVAVNNNTIPPAFHTWGALQLMSSFPFMSTQGPGNNLCMIATGRASGNSVSGFMSYRAGP